MYQLSGEIHYLSGPNLQQISRVGPYVKDTGDRFLSILRSWSWGIFGEIVLVAVSYVNLEMTRKMLLHSYSVTVFLQEILETKCIPLM